MGHAEASVGGERSGTARAQSGVSSSSLRRQNLSSILTMIHMSGPASRSEIGAATGLARSSVAGLVGELETVGFLRQTRAVPDGRPGRPSPVVDVQPESAVLAFEVEVDSLAVAVVGLGGRVLSQRRADRAHDGGSVDQTFRDLGRLANECQSEADHARILAAGVAIAGLVDHRSGRVVSAPNLGWEGLDLGTEVGSACGFDGHIAVRNEGELALRAESVRGAAQGCRDVVYLSAKVGVGGGILSNGHFIVGRAGLGGEVGHLPVNPDGVRCNCGALGCFETEVGERTLLARAGLDPNGGRGETAKLVARASDGDDQALEAFATSGRWLGLGIVALAHTFNPEKVVLGGLYRSGFAYVVEPINEVLAERSFPTLDGLSIVPSDLGDAAPLLGAAELAFDHVLADPMGFASSD